MNSTNHPLYLDLRLPKPTSFRKQKQKDATKVNGVTTFTITSGSKKFYPVSEVRERKLARTSKNDSVNFQ